jgi:serine/threonine-protein kinase LATS1/2
VIQWEQCLQIPPESNLSPAAKDLIVRLCRGPEERLGNNGTAEVKGHPFFQDMNINFEDLRRQQAPYSPVIKFPTDTSNFDAVEMHNSGSEPDDLKANDLTWKNGKHPEHAFFEFTFRRFFDEGGHPYATKLHDPETDAPVYV